MCKGKRLNH